MIYFITIRVILLRKSYKVPLRHFKNIKEGNIALEKAEQEKKISSKLNEIVKGRKKSEEQISVRNNIKTHNKSREKVIKLFEGNYRIVSEAKYKRIYGEGLKILTPKQMIQRLPISLAQVKACNTSENLLNEIRQIIYSVYQSKEITESV